MNLVASIIKNGQKYEADLSAPVDISLPLREGPETVNCFYAPWMETSPVEAGSFIGSIDKGGPVNFLNVKINPHGNGTHTECVGHIAPGGFTINKSLKNFHFLAKLVSLFPTKQEDGDRVILREHLKDVLAPGEAEALVIRTLPNDDRKRSMHYSGSNPPYVHHLAVEHITSCGVQHLLLDLPSVDREEDGGKLIAHRAFWGLNPGSEGPKRENCTITELIYAPNAIKDGLYLLNLQIASFEIDASPSKPVLYELHRVL